MRALSFTLVVGLSCLGGCRKPALDPWPQANHQVAPNVDPRTVPAGIPPAPGSRNCFGRVRPGYQVYVRVVGQFKRGNEDFFPWLGPDSVTVEFRSYVNHQRVGGVVRYSGPLRSPPQGNVYACVFVIDPGTYGDNHPHPTQPLEMLWVTTPDGR